MATSGIQSWNKRFRGKDVSTVLKRDSIGYDPNQPSKVLTQKISANEKVIALNSEYSPRYPIIRLKDNKKYLVKFDNIQKPGTNSDVKLLPKNLGVTGKYLRINEYIAILLENISNGDLEPSLKNYLQGLVMYYAKKEPLSYLNKYYSPNLPFNQIKKDFGELLGPLAIIKDNLLESKGINIPSNATIFFPIRSNEPLLDYKIKTGDKEYSISSKTAQKFTNVIKPASIIQLLSTDKKILNKWQNTIQFSILKQLNEGTIVSGPIMAASNFPDGPSPEAAVDVMNRSTRGYNDFSYDYNLMQPFIDSNKYLKERGNSATLNEIMYEAEKIISASSKNNIKYDKIFKDAILNQLIYVKFSINGKTPLFTSLVSSDFKENNVYLRSKNSHQRRKDKMGIQV